jgi:hypothetical protein
VIFTLALREDLVSSGGVASDLGWDTLTNDGANARGDLNPGVLLPVKLGPEGRQNPDLA